MFETAALLPYLRVLAIVSLAFAEVSCGGECGTSDSVTILDTRDGDYLVYRVSGAQDKVEFFEVYQGEPKFDSCGSTRTPVLATEPYQRSHGFLKKLELHANRLEIVYTANVLESIEPSKARLSQ
jgi:hypothetical protein